MVLPSQILLAGARLSSIGLSIKIISTIFAISMKRLFHFNISKVESITILTQTLFGWKRPEVTRKNSRPLLYCLMESITYYQWFLFTGSQTIIPNYFKRHEIDISRHLIKWNDTVDMNDLLFLKSIELYFLPAIDSHPDFFAFDFCSNTKPQLY